MEDAEFEWRDEKAASNWREHRITFRKAVKLAMIPSSLSGSISGKIMVKSASISWECVTASSCT
jgi:hypothetical protein